MATWRRFEQSPGLTFRGDTLRGVLRALRLRHDELVALLNHGQLPLTAADAQSTARAASSNAHWAGRHDGLTPRMVAAIESALGMAQHMLESDLREGEIDPTEHSILEEFDSRIFVAVGDNLTWYRMISQRMLRLAQQLERGRFIEESCECFADAAIFAAAVRNAAETWDDNEAMGLWHELADDLDDDLRDDRWSLIEDELDDLIPFREWDCIFPEYRKARLLIERRHPHTWFDESDEELQAFRDLAPHNVLAQELVGLTSSRPPSVIGATADTRSRLSPDEIEIGLTVPKDIANATVSWAETQDKERGDWPSQREVPQPQPPWPSQDNPVMRYLLWKAKASVDAGMKPADAMIVLAVHAWFEGGIEGYDRGQRDSRQHLG
jgi:hypothetical protein